MTFPLLLAQQTSPTPEIRDIAAPLYVWPYPLWVVYTVAIGSVGAIGMIVWLFVRWLRRRPARKPPTPREAAVAALEKARHQVQGTEPYAFSILVSDILRGYVSSGYSLRAEKQTSPEFLASIADYPTFGATEKQLLANFLEKCDLIKFARIDASANDSSGLLDQAILFVKGGTA